MAHEDNLAKKKVKAYSVALRAIFAIFVIVMLPLTAKGQADPSSDLLASPSSRAQDSQCLLPEDRASFAIVALKNYLMVMTLRCRSDSSYNNFINREKPVLNQSEKDVGEFFRRTRGANAQAERDAYYKALLDHLAGTTDESMCRGNDKLWSGVAEAGTLQKLVGVASSQLGSSYPLPRCGAGGSSAIR